MAHKKAGGSTSLGRDSVAKRLGVKLYEGQFAKAGNILVRQKGTKIHAGRNVMKGKNDTLFAVTDGLVRFKQKKIRGYDGNLKLRKFVNIEPAK